MRAAFRSYCAVWCGDYRLKVKVPDIYIPPLSGKPEQQWFLIIRSGVQTRTSSRQRSAISGRPLFERTVFGPARQTHLCPGQLH